MYSIDHPTGCVQCVLTAVQLYHHFYLTPSHSLSLLVSANALNIPPRALDRSMHFWSSSLGEVVVGGIALNAGDTYAQFPPSLNDSFCSIEPIMLRKGSYKLVVTGGVNPCHGHLALSFVRARPADPSRLLPAFYDGEDDEADGGDGGEGGGTKAIAFAPLDWFGATTEHPVAKVRFISSRLLVV